jgi:hypothetical protein
MSRVAVLCDGVTASGTTAVVTGGATAFETGCLWTARRSVREIDEVM